MRCKQCEMIPVTEIHTPQEYAMCLNALMNMVRAGVVEMTYQTCPLDEVLDDENKFYSQKIFHQFRCKSCGTIYGMAVDARIGGQIKINDKIFNPDDYETKDKE